MKNFIPSSEGDFSIFESRSGIIVLTPMMKHITAKPKAGLHQKMELTLRACKSKPWPGVRRLYL